MEMPFEQKFTLKGLDTGDDDIYAYRYYSGDVNGNKSTYDITEAMTFDTLELATEYLSKSTSFPKTKWYVYPFVLLDTNLFLTGNLTSDV